MTALHVPDSGHMATEDEELEVGCCRHPTRRTHELLDLVRVRVRVRVRARARARVRVRHELSDQHGVTPPRRRAGVITLLCQVVAASHLVGIAIVSTPAPPEAIAVSAAL